MYFLKIRRIYIPSPKPLLRTTVRIWVRTSQRGIAGPKVFIASGLTQATVCMRGRRSLLAAMIPITWTNAGKKRILDYTCCKCLPKLCLSTAIWRAVRRQMGHGESFACHDAFVAWVNDTYKVGIEGRAPSCGWQDAVHVIWAIRVSIATWLAVARTTPMRYFVECAAAFISGSLHSKATNIGLGASGTVKGMPSNVLAECDHAPKLHCHSTSSQDQQGQPHCLIAMLLALRGQVSISSCGTDATQAYPMLTTIPTPPN